MEMARERAAKEKIEAPEGAVSGQVFKLKAMMSTKLERAKTGIGFYAPEDCRDEEQSEQVYKVLRPHSRMTFSELLKN